MFDCTTELELRPEAAAATKDLTMPPPTAPKIYHIVHIDRLPSIITDGGLWCDAEIAQRPTSGTTIGMKEIKRRRLEKRLRTHPDLNVGECVPFNFCPRSVMLYVIARANHPQLTYRGGQDPIVHMEADLHRVVAWGARNARRWAFTSSNAGSSYFRDYGDLAQLDEIDWAAVGATDWAGCKEGKQAEFLIERFFPWALVERVGAGSSGVHDRARAAMTGAGHRPVVERKPEWYY